MQFLRIDAILYVCNVTANEKLQATSISVIGKQNVLGNHLGNVLITVSDKPIYKVSGGTVYFNPEISSISDYYPFGAPIAGRSAAFGCEYRFGFNKQEKTDEIAGSGNHNTATFWEYDGRLGRRWNIDPVTKPWESLYACLSNNPILMVDPDGNDTIDINKNENGKWIVSNAQILKGNDIFRVKNGDETKIYTFSGGEYGKRINYLRLDDKNSETFGMFQLSGTNTTGYIVEPEGPDTRESGKNKRIPEGEYNIKYSIGSLWPGYPQIYNNEVSMGRGVKLHWGSSRKWSEACLVVANDYYLDPQGKVRFDISNSENTSKIVNSYLGASDYDSSFLNANGKRRGKNIYSSTARINSSKLLIGKIW